LRHSGWQDENRAIIRHIGEKGRVGGAIDRQLRKPYWPLGLEGNALKVKSTRDRVIRFHPGGLMFVFTPKFSPDDVRRVSEKMNSRPGEESHLSERSKQILNAINFSSEELTKAASATVVMTVSIAS
jgi:hypothetical protein